jgi:mycofactocin system glycosyltransferase
MGMRLNRQAFALLSAVADGGRTADAAARAAGLSAMDAAHFLDRLARRRLLVRTPPAPGRWPQVSIIVAARGRHRATRACVDSLLALAYPGERCEIIVVDDASEPPLAAALAGLPIRLIRLDRNIGQSAARNLAAADARGELLAFIDNDCIADPAWLRSLVPYLDDPAVAMVGGRVVAPPPARPVAAFEAVRSPLDMGAIASGVGPDEVVAYLPTCNFVVRRDVLLAASGFDADMRLGEDVDFTWRVLRTGARACYVPLGHVTHHHRERLGPLLRRRADYASSEADLQRRHPAGRRVMPMPRASFLMLAAVTALPMSGPVAIALAVLVAMLLTHEMAGKRRRIRELGITLPASRIGAAVLREHTASMYGLSANVVRYYGLPLLGLAALVPVLLPATAVLFVLAPTMDHRRLKPACGLPVFIGLSWLEMAAYQLGVWRGCLARRTLRPLLPILHWRR